MQKEQTSVRPSASRLASTLSHLLTAQPVRPVTLVNGRERATPETEMDGEIKKEDDNYKK